MYMENELIQFETAKLAKEKSFNLVCNQGYNMSEKYLGNLILNLINKNSDNIVISAPEQSLLQRWLREVHNLHIYVDTTTDFGNMESHRSKYKSSVKVPFKPFKWTTGVYYLGDTYEEALEKGLVAALKLIK